MANVSLWNGTFTNLNNFMLIRIKWNINMSRFFFDALKEVLLLSDFISDNSYII